MQCLDDFRLSFKGREFLPLMVGGMGTNISTANLVLAIEKLGGMAHLSDAMLPDVADREIGTHFTKEKSIFFKSMIQEADKTEEKFNLEAILYRRDGKGNRKGIGSRELHGKAHDE